MQASRRRLAVAEAPAFFACKRILHCSHFTNRARSKAFGRSMFRRSLFEIRKKKTETIVSRWHTDAERATRLRARDEGARNLLTLLPSVIDQ